MKKLTCLLIIICLIVSFSGCKTDETIESPSVTPSLQSGIKDEAAIQLAFSLFSKLSETDGNKNIIMSPLSVSTAVAMAANGADGDTLKELEALLGSDIESFNAYSKELYKNAGSQLKSANSLWVQKNGFKSEKAYKDTLKSVYQAELKSVPMNNKTLADINSWVEKKTDGMIKEILPQLAPNTVSVLINALSFDAKWEVAYEKKDVKENGNFYTGTDTQDATYMYSEENTYLQNSYLSGFAKPYKNGKYSFVGLLPNDGYTADFVAKHMTATEYKNMMASATKQKVNVSIPMFESDYFVNLNETLKALGVNAAFDERAADFSKAGKSDAGNVYINKVMHKAAITVDADGTKAAATTVMEGVIGSVAPPQEKYVSLCRPFVYMIIDNQTNTPVFMGIVNSLK